MWTHIDTVLFDAALQDYQNKTGITLAEHPLAEQLQNCRTVESVTDVLHEQTQAFNEFWGNHKVLKSLRTVLSVLHTLSAAADFDESISKTFPPVKAIHTGLGVLLSTVKGVIDSYDLLIDLLESFDDFLKRLEIYTKIDPTAAMSEMAVKILVELLSTLALVTKQIKQGKTKKFFKKLLGEKDVEAVLKRLDRLTKKEAQITAAHTLEVVYGLIKNMEAVLNDGKASAEHVMEALKIMQKLASDQNKSKRDDLQKDILRWLSPPDPWKNHHIARKSRHRGSAAWFIQGDTYSEWKASEAPISSLWIHGKPGAGKSVFCSTIIEDVDAMRKAGLASLAFFYCDFREEEKTGLRGLLSSLLAQLCHQSDPYCDTLSKFYSEHAKGSRPPSDDALVECLKDLLNLPGLAPVYILIDALDECPNSSAVPSSREEVLNFLESLIESQFPNLRICVTSRPEADIKDVLDLLIPCHVSLHDEGGQKRDINEYIKSVINTHRKNKDWKAEDKQLVIDFLMKNANGMFRWVECQVVYLCGCFPAGIKRALVDLPDTLDKTYERTLREINKVNWEFVHRLFQFVAVASRPLRAEELAELLAVDFDAGSIPKFHEGWRVEDPIGSVLSRCSTLLAIVDVGSLPKTDNGGIPFPSPSIGYRSKEAEDGYRSGKVVQFSHYSVKEFLASTRLAGATDIILRRYHVSMTSAHTLAAQACLAILFHLDEDVVTRGDLAKWPLAQYAAEHWVYHAQFEDVSRNVEDGMKQLFDPNKPHLAICFSIHKPRISFHFLQTQEMDIPSNYRYRKLSPLHYAALWGFDFMVEFLIIERSQNVNSYHFANHLPPFFLAWIHGHIKTARIIIEHGVDVTGHVDFIPLLHWVSERGPVEIAHMFIERGADISAKDRDGKTPLHWAALGQAEIAHMLIERGADISAKDHNGKTPLHWAARGQAEIAHMLIERGADITAKDKSGVSPIYTASVWGQVEIARMLIERGADVKAKDNNGSTPLNAALVERQVEIARLLIERGADATDQNVQGNTPLHLALQNKHEEIARMLIEYGADVTARDRHEDTPLHLASSQGQVEVAHLLIDYASDMTAQNEDGDTPLLLASRKGQVEVARMLIERGADVAAQNKDGETPLRLALQLGQVVVACMLIECGANVTAQNKHGESPLHLASRKGQAEVARMLIERGADVAAQNKDGETPLHLALQLGQVVVACMLIESGTDVTTQNKNGFTLLHLASRHGQVEAINMLIERGADVSAKDNYGQAPLQIASNRRRVEAVRMLIERGADVTTMDNNGDTSLHWAACWGPVEFARMLIERGADVTAQNVKGVTPLHLALQNRHEEIARMLIEHGADVTARDSQEETLLHLASRGRQVEVVRMLIERGADVAARNSNEDTPLHLASGAGQVEVVRMLFEHGADVTARNKHEENPLHRASKSGQVEVVRILFERGADFTAQNVQGHTPLHLASQEGWVETACMLIDHGADVTARNPDEETPLHLASQGRQVEVVRLLIERGADVTAQDVHGDTPLHPASREGRVEIACMLIDHGADVTARNKHEETPLHLASRKGLVRVVRMLTDRGADVTAQNENGDTPLHLASTLSWSWFTGQMDFESFSNILLEHGADANARNTDGLTPLCLASQRGHRVVKRILLDHGADPGEMSASERPPVMSPAHSLAPSLTHLDLISFDPDEIFVPGSLPVTGTSPAHSLAHSDLISFDSDEIFVPGSPPVTSLAHSLADLPGSDSGEIPVLESPPVTSSVHIFADLLIPSHSSLTTPNVANTDLPQTPPPFPNHSRMTNPIAPQSSPLDYPFIL